MGEGTGGGGGGAWRVQVKVADYCKGHQLIDFFFNMTDAQPTAKGISPTAIQKSSKSQVKSESLFEVTYHSRLKRTGVK